jgi:hypothetical protein
MSAMSRTKHDVENEIVYCTRCGIGQSFEQVYKRKIRNAVNAEWCRDCRDDRTEIRRDYAWKHPALGKVHCWLWTGELNDNWQPITEDGELYRPGERLCGLKDCVKQAHIITPEKPPTDQKLLLAMIEMQDYNKRARTKNEQA